LSGVLPTPVGTPSDQCPINVISFAAPVLREGGVGPLLGDALEGTPE